MNTLLMRVLAVLNLGEGLIHMVTAGVSFWGMVSLGVWDWRVATSPTADAGLGVVSLMTGLVLKRLPGRQPASSSGG
jgi:hypothetical protein